MAKTKPEVTDMEYKEELEVPKFILYMEDDLYTFEVEGLKEEDMTTHIQMQILKTCSAQGPGVYVDVSPHITVTVKAKDAATTEEA